MGFYIGYYGIMLTCMIVAAVRRKHSDAWVWYIVGAIVQLFSLIGATRNPFIRSGSLWAVYFVILIIFAVILCTAKESGPREYIETPSPVSALRLPDENIKPYRREKRWICTCCGKHNPDRVFICSCGRKKTDNDEDSESWTSISEKCAAGLQGEAVEFNAYAKTVDNERTYEYIRTATNESVAMIGEKKNYQGNVYIFSPKHSWECYKGKDNKMVFGDTRTIISSNAQEMKLDIGYKGVGTYDLGGVMTAYEYMNTIAFYLNDVIVGKAVWSEDDSSDSNRPILRMQLSKIIDEHNQLVLQAVPFVIDD